MNCERVRELLSPHLDDALIDPDRAALLSHLEDCVPCRERFESLDQVVSLIRGIPPAVAPEGLHEAVLFGLPARSRRKSRLLNLVPAAAAACLLICFGTLGARHFLVDSASPPVEVGMLDSAEEGLAVRDTRLGSPGEATVAKSTLPPSPVTSLDGTFAEEKVPDRFSPAERPPAEVDRLVIGIGGGAGGRLRTERALEYVVKGGRPDATAGLILAELHNRRARFSKKEKRCEAGAPSGASAVLERVVSNDQGEPARLVLYLTADEVKYILTLLAERNGGTLISGDIAPAREVSRTAGDRVDAGAAVSTPGSSRPAPPQDAPPDAEDESKSAPHRFRVDLRFDR